MKDIDGYSRCMERSECQEKCLPPSETSELSTHNSLTNSASYNVRATIYLYPMLNIILAFVRSFMTIPYSSHTQLNPFDAQVDEI